MWIKRSKERGEFWGSVFDSESDELMLDPEEMEDKVAEYIFENKEILAEYSFQDDVSGDEIVIPADEVYNKDFVYWFEHTNPEELSQEEIKIRILNSKTL